MSITRLLTFISFLFIFSHVRFLVSGVSAAACRRSDQFNPKKKLPIGEFHTRVGGWRLEAKNNKCQVSGVRCQVSRLDVRCSFFKVQDSMLDVRCSIINHKSTIINHKSTCGVSYEVSGVRAQELKAER